MSSIRTAMAFCSLLLGAATGYAEGLTANDPESLAVEQLFTHDFAQRWRAGDAEGLAQLWAEDGDWMGLLGSRHLQSGRAAVAAVWQVGLTGRDTPWHRALDVRVDALRELADGLYQVDLTLTFGSAATGALREAMVATAVRKAGGWRIATARVARISSEAPSVDAAPEVHTIGESWSLGPEPFCEPETVVWDGTREVYLVSNVCGFSANGKGYLSRLTATGELEAARWVEGLDAPAGMMVAGDSLWVVDLEVVREHSLEDGRELSRVALPDDARAPNDLTISGGIIYVTDSFRNAIYAIENGSAEILVQDNRLRFANGIHAEGGRLWVGGETVREIDLESGGIGPPLGPLQLTDVDGIEGDGKGGLVFSLVGGPVIHLPATGAVAVFATEGLSSANLLYRPESRLAVVPQGTGMGIVAFRLPLDGD